MMICRVVHLTILSVLGAFCLTATSAVATAGPVTGIAQAKFNTGSGTAVQKVHYRRKYHKHRRIHRKRRYYRGYDRRRVVRAPFTRVETGRRVIVDAPFAHVRVGRGVRVRAPFVDLYIPRTRRAYRSRYW